MTHVKSYIKFQETESGSVFKEIKLLVKTNLCQKGSKNHVHVFPENVTTWYVQISTSVLYIQEVYIRLPCMVDHNMRPTF